MADWSDAVVAIRAKFVELWADRTRIQFQNEQVEDPWPPVDEAGRQTAYVYLEVTQTSDELRGAGTPGNNLWLASGLICIYVFVPLNQGSAQAELLATQAGQLLRTISFFRDGSGTSIRTLGFTVSGGDSSSDDGTWWGVECIVPFQFYHRG